MNKYDKYKDSGIDWIGEIPEHWNLQRLKYLTDITTGDKDTVNRDDNGEYPFFVRSKKIERISTYSFDGEAILTAGDGDIGKIFHYINGKFDFHQRVYKLSHFTNIKGKFLYYFMQSKFYYEVIRISAKATVDSLRLPMLQNFQTTVPSEKEQNNIIAYLDKQTSNIDQLIAQKEQLLKFYEEEKTTIINQAVTKGTKPDAPMKDSGVEWMGEIPENWNTKKLKYIISNLESGVSVNSSDIPIAEGGLGILKTSCVYNYVFDPNENKEIWTSEIDRAKTNPRKGEIIISRMNTPELVGASGYVDKDYNNLFLPDRLWQTVFNPSVEVNSKWLSYILKSIQFRNLLSVTATGTSPSMKNLAQEAFLNISIPWIKKAEQDEIVNYIDSDLERLDSKVEKTKKLLELLNKYKQSLISEVVTGKVKVI